MIMHFVLLPLVTYLFARWLMPLVKWHPLQRGILDPPLSGKVDLFVCKMVNASGKRSISDFIMIR